MIDEQSISRAIETEHKYFPGMLKYYAVSISFFVLLSGLLILTGWIFNIPQLTGAAFGFITIKMNTSICFILSSISLLIQITKKNKIAIKISQALACLVFTTGFLTLLEFIFNIDFGIDQLFVTEPINSYLTPFPQRMAVNTAIAFIFTGTALFINIGKKLSEFRYLTLAILASGVSGFGLITIVTYLLGIINLAVNYRLALMSLPTAVIFILLGLGLLFVALYNSKWRISFEKRVVEWFLGGLIVIIIVSLLSYKSTILLLENENWISHTNLVIQKIESVISGLKDAETGQHGYIMAGRKSYLEPYFNSLNKINDNIFELEKLTSDNAQQQKRIEILKFLSKEKFKELELTISKKDREGFESALKIILTDKGKEIMDSVRTVCNMMKNTERNFLEERQHQVNNAANLTLYSIPMGVFLSTSFLLCALYLIGVENKKRQDAEQELNKNNQELEIKIEERTAELTRSNKELEQFAYVASHDLQEPLRMISTYTTLVERRIKDKLDDNTKECFEIIVDGSKRMQSLIHGLLTYSRISSESEPYSKTDLNLILKDVLKDLNHIIDDSCAVININTLPVINAYPLLMKQLFQNLISNAIKFRDAKKKPVIDINAAVTDGICKFSVKDNGIGIAPEYHDKIFIIFQKLHSRDTYSGTGIGLAICKRIIEQHGGNIWVESEEGKGCTFYFTMPVL